MQVEKILVVSTAHLTSNDVFFLEDDYDHPLLSACTPHYFLIHLPSIDEACAEDMEYFSSAFKELIAFAKNHYEDFTYLKLDCDGDKLDMFPTHDW